MFLTGNNSYRNALLPALLAAVLLLMGCSEGRDMRRLLRNVPAEAETVVCVNIEALAKEFRLTVDANRLTLPQRYAAIEPQADAALLQLLKSGAIRLSAVVMFRVESHTFITGFVADKDAFMQMVESRTGRQFSNQGDRQVCGPVTIIGDRFWVSDADASKVYELSRLKGDDALPRKAADMLADDADDGFAMLTKCDALTAMAGNSPVATQIARQILGEAGYLCLKGDVDDDELELDGEFLNQQFQPVRNPGTLAVIDRNALLTLLPDAEKVTAIGLQKATLQQIAAAMPSALTQNAADVFAGTFAIAVNTMAIDSTGMPAMTVTATLLPGADTTTLSHTMTAALPQSLPVNVVGNQLFIGRQPAQVAQGAVWPHIDDLNGALFGMALSPQALDRQFPLMNMHSGGLTMAVKADDDGQHLEMNVRIYTGSEENILLMLLNPMLQNMVIRGEWQAKKSGKITR